MAYETGAATTQQDLIQKLHTFAVTNGWTQDELDTTNKRSGLHLGNCYVQFRWDSVASTGSIGLYQSLGFTPGQWPGNHPSDSGNGYIGTPITTQRRVSGIGNGAFPTYYFFSDTTYLYVVLEYVTGLYRHFGFGVVEKVGTWTGGEFVVAHVWSATQPDYPTGSYHNLLFDAHSPGASYATECGTIHAEGLPNQSGSGKWGVVWGYSGAVANNGLDRGSNQRVAVVGGTRSGPMVNALCWCPANGANGFLAMAPIPLFYNWYATPPELRLIGFAPALRVINLRYFVAAEEVTVGADTWKIFPWVRKRHLKDGAAESWNAGLAYLKT
jgi:hypothetical protein